MPVLEFIRLAMQRLYNCQSEGKLSLLTLLRGLGDVSAFYIMLRAEPDWWHR